MASFFSLPSEVVLSTLCARFPCRQQQIRSLTTLLSIRGAPCRNVVLHGLEATGKSSICKALLEKLSSEASNGVNGNSESTNETLRYAIVRSAECITGRHLLEQTVGLVAKALDHRGNLGRCENISVLAVEIGKLLDGWTPDEDEKQRFVLVFDGIDKQRDAPPTLLPALARVGELIPNLTIVFVITAPRPDFLHNPGVPHILFSAYTKAELLQIISSHKPSPPLPSGEGDTKQTWSSFTTAVHDSLSKHSGRDILSFRSGCTRLWPRFIQPILSGQLDPKPFSKLMIANRSLFQNDSALVHDIISTTSKLSLEPQTAQAKAATKYQNIASLLPTHSRLLLVAAYLASFNPPKTDMLYFMKSAISKRRKKGGGTALSRPGVSKSRKISRKLLGAQAFMLERMLAIFHAIREDSDLGRKKRSIAGSADVQMAVGTLVSLRLVVRLGATNASDVLEAGVRYKIAVGWEVVKGVGRSVGVEVEDYLDD